MIFLDHHSTTPCDPRVVEAMLPWLTEHFGNPHSGSHELGRRAADAIDDSLSSMAAVLGLKSDHLLVTSGATESLNLAIRGVMMHPRCQRRRLVTCATEHPAVLEIASDLQTLGVEVVIVGVHPQGRPNAGQVDLDQLADAVNGDTALVSIMIANNEMGAIHPIDVVGRIAHEKGALLHCDASQAVGRLRVDAFKLDIDCLTASAHKFYGPKGIGILTVGNGRRRVRIRPQTVGGGQQRGLRGGTMDPAGIVAMAKALEIANEELSYAPEKIGALRNQLWDRLSRELPELILHGPALDGAIDDLSWPSRLPGNLNVRLPDVDGEAWMLATPEVAMSSGSACSSTDGLPSHVLLAMGLNESEARRSVRLGLGRFNTPSEVDFAAEKLLAGVRKLRSDVPN